MGMWIFPNSPDTRPQLPSSLLAGQQVVNKPTHLFQSRVLRVSCWSWHNDTSLLRCVISPPSVFQHQVKVSSSSRLGRAGRRAASKQNRAHDLLMITMSWLETGERRLGPGQTGSPPAWDGERRVNTCNKTGSGQSQIVFSFDWSHDWHWLGWS